MLKDVIAALYSVVVHAFLIITFNLNFAQIVKQDIQSMQQQEPAKQMLIHK